MKGGVDTLPVRGQCHFRSPLGTLAEDRPIPIDDPDIAIPRYGRPKRRVRLSAGWTLVIGEHHDSQVPLAADFLW
jgi:hypothetical protein